MFYYLTEALVKKYWRKDYKAWFAALTPDQVSRLHPIGDNTLFVDFNDYIRYRKFGVTYSAFFYHFERMGDKRCAICGRLYNEHSGIRCFPVWQTEATASRYTGWWHEPQRTKMELTSANVRALAALHQVDVVSDAPVSSLFNRWRT